METKRTTTTTTTLTGEAVDLERRGVVATERVVGVLEQAARDGLFALQAEHWRLANAAKRQELENTLLVRVCNERRLGATYSPEEIGGILAEVQRRAAEAAEGADD